MKTCPHCHRTLPESEYYPSRRPKDKGLYWCCKACDRAYKKGSYDKSGRAKYQLSELLSRPFEHKLERLNCKQVGEALGINKDTAAAFIDAPWAFCDTPWGDRDVANNKLHAWIENQV